MFIKKCNILLIVVFLLIINGCGAIENQSIKKEKEQASKQAKLTKDQKKRIRSYNKYANSLMQLFEELSISDEEIEKSDHITTIKKDKIISKISPLATDINNDIIKEKGFKIDERLTSTLASWYENNTIDINIERVQKGGPAGIEIFKDPIDPENKCVSLAIEIERYGVLGIGRNIYQLVKYVGGNKLKTTFSPLMLDKEKLSEFKGTGTTPYAQFKAECCGDQCILTEKLEISAIYNYKTKKYDTFHTKVKSLIDPNKRKVVKKNKQNLLNDYTYDTSYKRTIAIIKDENDRIYKKNGSKKKDKDFNIHEKLKKEALKDLRDNGLPEYIIEDNPNISGIHFIKPESIKNIQYSEYRDRSKDGIIKIDTKSTLKDITDKAIGITAYRNSDNSNKCTAKFFDSKGKEIGRFVGKERNVIIIEDGTSKGICGDRVTYATVCKKEDEGTMVGIVRKGSIWSNDKPYTPGETVLNRDSCLNNNEFNLYDTDHDRSVEECLKSRLPLNK